MLERKWSTHKKDAKSEEKQEPETKASSPKLLMMRELSLDTKGYVVDEKGGVGGTCSYGHYNIRTEPFLEIDVGNKCFVNLDDVVRTGFAEMKEIELLGTVYTKVPYMEEQSRFYRKIRAVGSLEEVFKKIDDFSKNDEKILDLASDWDAIIKAASQDKNAKYKWAKEQSEQVKSDLAEAKKENTFTRRLSRFFGIASKKDTATPATAKANDDTQPTGQQAPKATKSTGNAP